MWIITFIICFFVFAYGLGKMYSSLFKVRQNEREDSMAKLAQSLEKSEYKLMLHYDALLKDAKKLRKIK